MLNSRRPRFAFCTFLLCCALCAASSGQGAVRFWDGETGNSNWFDAVNWDGNAALPGAGDAVVVTNGVPLLLTNQTPWLASVAVSNTTFTFSGTVALEAVLRATGVTVNAGGTLTHAPNSALSTNSAGAWDMDNRVAVECDTLTIDAGGSIDVTGQGFRGGVGTSYGFGPGGATVVYAGGGHATTGSGSHQGGGGPAYGVSSAPDLPGSGGAGYNGFVDRYGGNGGGSVRIAASGAVTVHGTLAADGAQGVSYGGGGSGGAVYIMCGTIDGNGAISARGGDGASAYGGGGSGGRIALAYSDLASQALLSPNLLITTERGSSGANAEWREQAGTLHLSDSSFLPEQDMADAYYWLIIPGFAAWQPDHLSVTSSWVRIDALSLSATNSVHVHDNGSLVLTNSTALACDSLTVDGKLIVDGPVSHGGTVTVNAGAFFSMWGPFAYATGFTLEGTMHVRNPLTSNTIFSCGGDLVITNGGALHAHAGPTNTGTTANGGLLAAAGDIEVAPSSALYLSSHATNGASVLVQAANVHVMDGGAISAEGRGYGPDYDTGPGHGPGGGRIRGSSWYGGGGYGGRGGDGTTYDLGGLPYGTAQPPLMPGSAGASYPYSRADTYNGRHGGGLIRIQTPGHVRVNGTLNADGAGDGTQSAGAGSGGGIWVECGTIDGNGTITARGGRSNFGGGGGGRIALAYTNSAAQALLSPAISFDTSGGTGKNTSYSGMQKGANGSLYLVDNSFLPAPDLSGTYSLAIPGFTSWSPAYLHVATGTIEFAEDFTLDVAGALTVGAEGELVFRGNSSLACNSLMLTNGGALTIHSGTTNGVAEYGATLSVASEMVVASGSTNRVYGHPTNAASVLITANSLLVAAGGAIDSDGGGFQGGGDRDFSDPEPFTRAFGPGHGWWYYGGAGYGGHGGTNYSSSPSYPSAGAVYGSAEHPDQPGSGGAGYNESYSHYWGGSGGGLVRIVAESTLRVDGTITAGGRKGGCSLDGDAGFGSGGGGSGGAIYLHCRSFEGGGILQAKGGSGSNGTYTGAGGGGRIAVWRRNHNWTGSTDVSPGPVSRTPAGAGTVHWGDLPPAGTLVIIM